VIAIFLLIADGGAHMIIHEVFAFPFHSIAYNLLYIFVLADEALELLLEGIHHQPVLLRGLLIRKPVLLGDDVVALLAPFLAIDVEDGVLLPALVQQIHINLSIVEGGVVLLHIVFGAPPPSAFLQILLASSQCFVEVSSPG
jgi:hypothetical protein